MGNTWQTDAHRAFFEEHLTAFVTSSEEGTLKAFWPGILEKWFKSWPLSDPPHELVEKEGLKAKKIWKYREVEVSVAESTYYLLVLTLSTAG